MARLAREYRKLELGVTAFPPVGGKGDLESLFKHLSADLDIEHVTIDGTICPGSPARRQGKEDQNQAIGCSRSGLAPVIVALTDALGKPARFILLPGPRHDGVGVLPLTGGLAFCKSRCVQARPSQAARR